jgi:predicted RNA-binding protein YlxR (DUF448 family)/ribosomal protein L30E
MTEAGEALSERMCIVTRKVMDEEHLLRFVRSPEGEVVPDLRGSLPGRGVWVTLGRSKVAEAQRKGLFARGFHAESRPHDDLAGLVGDLLRKTALAYLPMARKAGLAVCGFMKATELCRGGNAQIVIHASDGSADGRRKLNAAAAPGVATVELFTGNELDLAFGRSNVVHAALARVGLAEKFLAAVRRIEIYEAG